MHRQSTAAILQTLKHQDLPESRFGSFKKQIQLSFFFFWFFFFFVKFFALWPGFFIFASPVFSSFANFVRRVVGTTRSCRQRAGLRPLLGPASTAQPTLDGRKRRKKLAPKPKRLFVLVATQKTQTPRKHPKHPATQSAAPASRACVWRANPSISQTHLNRNSTSP